MRCPKCGYNSFDHNQLCPKCRKDLTAARRLFNLAVPIPGPVNFFQVANLRTAFGEMPAGADRFDDYPEPALAAIGSFAGNAVTSVDPSPFLEGLILEDITPLPDVVAPINDIQIFEADRVPNSFPTIAPGVAAMPFDLNPVIGEDEIEIDIIGDIPVQPAQAIPAPTSDQLAAMNQIMNTLAETGDLAAPVEVEIEELDQTEEVQAENYVPGEVATNGEEEFVIEDIVDSDILDDDFTGEEIDKSSDVLSIDLDSVDLATDFFEDASPETEPEPYVIPESAPQFQAASDQEDTFQEAPPSPVVSLELEEFGEVAAIDTDFGDLDLELEEEIRAQENLTADVPVAEAPVKAIDATVIIAEKRPNHPSAIPKIPARFFDSNVPETSPGNSKTDGSALETDDLTSLADDINLDDLDSEL